MSLHSRMAAGTIASALAEALSFVYPTWCVGCDAPDESLCAACRAQLDPAPRERIVDGLMIRSAMPFEGVAARALRALKEDGRTGLARPLGAALRTIAPTGIVAVPIPSSRAAMRRRGYAVAPLLARHAGLDARRLLVPGDAAVRDQRDLGVEGRRANVAGSLRARSAASAVGERVVLVDDVVTTGATLVEAAAVLRAAGAHVVGAVTVASTPKRVNTSGIAT